MKNKLLLVLFGLLLLSPGLLMAQKNLPDPMAASVDCPECSYTLLTQDGYFSGTTRHPVLFNSNSNQVRTAEISFKVHTTGTVDYFVDPVYPTYTTFDTSSTSDSTGLTINVFIDGIDDAVFTGDTLFILEVSSTECLIPGDSIQVEITDFPYSFFFTPGSPNNAYTPTKNDGYIVMLDPEVVVSVLGKDSTDVPPGSCPGQFPGDVNGDGQITLGDFTTLGSIIAGDYSLLPIPIQNCDANGDCLIDTLDQHAIIDSLYGPGTPLADCSCDPFPLLVDTNVVGGPVAVPIYLTKANFDYLDSASFSIMFNEKLLMDSIVTTDISAGLTYTNDDSMATFSLGDNSIVHPTEFPALLLTAWFTIDSNVAVPNEYYDITVYGDYLFAGCIDYYYEGSGDTAVVWVRSIIDSTLCYECNYTLDDSQILFEVDSLGYKSSYQLFSFDSDSQSVESSEVTLRIDYADDLLFEINDQGYGLPTIDSVTEGTVHWINLNWSSIGDSVFYDEDLFELILKTDGCESVDDSILVEVISNPAQGYENKFRPTGGSFDRYLGTLDDGSVFMRPPNVVISVLGHEEPLLPLDSCEGQMPGDLDLDNSIDISDINAMTAVIINKQWDRLPDPLQNADFNGDCIVDSLDYVDMYDFQFYGGDPPADCSCEEMPQLIDHNIVNESVTVPIYWRQINFDLDPSGIFFVKHDTALVFDSLIASDYTFGFSYMYGNDSIDYFTRSGQNEQHPDDLPATLLEIVYTIDSMKTFAGDYLPVEIYGDYNFQACIDYGFEGNGDLAMGWVYVDYDSMICYDCIAELPDDSIYYDVDANDLKTSEHVYSFSSDSQSVSEIEVTIKVNSADSVAYTIDDLGYGTPTATDYRVGSEFWINLHWASIPDSVFDSTPLFELNLMTAECQAVDDSLLFEIANNDSLGIFNRFKVTGATYYQYPISYDSSYVLMHDPLVRLSLWESDNLPTPPATCSLQYPGDANGDNMLGNSDLARLIDFHYLGGYDSPPEPLQNADANGDCVLDTTDITYMVDWMYTGGPDLADCSCEDLMQILDTGFVGDPVAVPVYTRDVNFDYRGGYTIGFFFDPALQYDSIVTNQYSTGTTDNTGVTDSTVVFELGNNLIDRPTDPELPEVLFTIYMTLDSTSTIPGALYPVRIDGDYTFTGCGDYAQTNDDDIPVTWVRAVWDLTKACPHCGVALADDSVYYEVDSTLMRGSRHIFTFDSDGQQVDDLELTLRVFTDDSVDFSFVDLGFGTPTTSSYADDSSFYINMIWTSMGDSVFTGENLVELYLETRQCLTTSDSLLLHFEDLPSQSYQTAFTQTTTGYVKRIVDRSYASIYMYGPELNVSLVPTGDTTGTIVDSTFGSTPVTVPVYINDINFDYTTYGLWAKWESGLTLDSIVGSEYADPISQVNYTDSVLIYNNTDLFDHPETFPTAMATMWFTIDTINYLSGTDFKVEFYREPIFVGCGDYLDTSFTSDEYVYVRYSDSGICLDCGYTLSDYPTEFFYGFNVTQAYSDFSFDSDNRQVAQIEMTMRVHAENVYQVHIQDTAIANYATIEFNRVDDDSTTWINTVITGIPDSVFNGGTVISYYFLIGECMAPYDSLQIEIVDLPDSGFYNRFYDESGFTRTMLDENENDGYIWFTEPIVDLGLYDTSGTDGDTAVASYVGDIIHLPIYFRDITMDYNQGFIFTLFFDPALTFQSITQTSYSDGLYHQTEATNLTDTSVTFTYQGDWILHPTDPNVVLLYADFYLDPATTVPDSIYKVWMNGDYIFSGCEFIADTNSSTDYAYVHTVPQTATLDFGTLSMAVNANGGKLYFYCKSSAPIETDVLNDMSGINFAFDTTGYTYSDFSGWSTKYPYENDTLYWEMETIDGDTVAFDENRTQQSTYIRQSASLHTIGYLTFDAGSSAGSDNVDFVRFEDSDSSFYLHNNFVVFKYTGDTIRYIDSIVMDSIYYGGLSLSGGTVTVTDGGGDDPIGCPMLSAWNGAGWVQEDFILTQSHNQLSPEPVDDYYPLELASIDEDGYYRLKISEYERELTYLDQVELISVDYPINSQVGISNSGHVYSYTDAIEPIAAVDQYGNDVLSLVSSADRVFYESNMAGSLTLTYPNVSSKLDSRGFALVVGDDGGVIKKDPGGGLESSISELSSLKAEIEDADGNWHDLGVVPPRQYLSENCSFFVDEDIAHFEKTIRVRISWDNNFRTDMQRLVLDDGLELEPVWKSPTIASHSKLGRTTHRLANIDDNVITLRPGEEIELSFAATTSEVPEGFLRKYFLKSHGYYRTMSAEELLPDTYELFANYPNPFNPSTTIKYSLPRAANVSLVIYNVLGQEVNTLVDGFVEPGIHEAIWNGDNDHGSQVASGVYFYRLRVDDFDRSRKMILLK